LANRRIVITNMNGQPKFSFPFLAVAEVARLPNSTALALLYTTCSMFGGLTSLHAVLLCSLPWFFAACASYALNDLIDEQVDIINHPKRPLPSASISRALALRVAVTSGGLAVLTTASFWPYTRPWPLIGLAGGLLYSLAVRRRHALTANILTATLVAIIPLSAIRSGSSGLLAVAAALFAMTVAREMKKDFLDRDGDRGYRAPGFLVSHRAAGSAWYLCFVAFALVALLWQVKASGSVSFWLAIVPLCIVIRLQVRAPRQNAVEEARLLKVAAYALIPALLFSGWHL
jgi:geranylgeranylglycerol-phosphate geranylgeranyltransferase